MIVGWWAGGLVGWWTSGLVGWWAVGCQLSAIRYCLLSIIYHLSSIFFPLFADRYLPAFETLTARTEILRCAQNDCVRRTAESG